MKKILFIVTVLSFYLTGYSQFDFKMKDNHFYNQISIGKQSSTNTNPAAWVEIGANPTTKGLILPRVTDTSYVTNVAGLIIYGKSDSTLYYGDGTYWRKVQSVPLSTFYWQTNGNSNAIQGTNFIGTTNNNYVSIKANNVEGIRVLTNGGIKMGSNTVVSGNNSVVMGTYSWASGDQSVAAGNTTISSGWASFAAGDHTTSPCNAQVTVGRWNTDFVPTGTGTDRLFVVGTGSMFSSKYDALVITRNGNVEFGASPLVSSLASATITLNYHTYFNQPMTIGGPEAFVPTDSPYLGSIMRFRPSLSYDMSTPATTVIPAYAGIYSDTNRLTAHYAITYTDASTLKIAGTPKAGTNVTITRPWALSVDNGMSYFSGGIQIAATQQSQASNLLIDVQSTTRGVAFPRMTTTEKNAIVSPVEGMEVYDLTLHQKSYYNGTTWINY